MRTILPILCVGAIATGAMAQTRVTVSLEAATDVGAFAKAGNTSDYKFIKKGTKITARPMRVTAQAGRNATASTGAGLGRTTAGIRATVFESGRAVLRAAGNASAGTSASSDPRNVTPGKHSWLLRLGVRRGQKVKVTATYMGRVTDKGAKATGGVDFDNDGKDDFTAMADGKSHTKTMELTAGANGIAIKLTTEASAAQTATGQAGYTATLVLSLGDSRGDGRCTFTRFGTSCGPLLNAREQTSARGTTVNFATVRAKASSLAAFIMGVRKINVRIPNTRCVLSVAPVLIFGRQTNAQGMATISFPIPDTFEGSIETQDVILFRDNRAISAQSTNGLTMACKKKQ